MKITVDELRRFVDAGLKQLEDAGVESFALDVDDYWDVSSEQRYRFSGKPTEFSV